MHRGGRWRLTLKRIITLHHMKANPIMGQFLEQLLDEHQFLLLGQLELIAHCYNIPLICLRTLNQVATFTYNDREVSQQTRQVNGYEVLRAV